MAVITPTSITQASVGSLKGVIAAFANTADNLDTWASGIPDIVWIGATQEDAAGTITSEGVGASWAAATGTITLYIGEDNAAVRLLILSGSAY